MSRPNPPALTVRYDGSTRTFAPGNDVVVGRDLRADVRIAHPLISRAHLVLRFDQGRWVAIDNGSLNGMYVNGRRVPAVDIADGQQRQHRQSRRSWADVRGGPPSGIGGHAAADHVGAAGIAAQPEHTRASRHHHRLRRARVSSPGRRPPDSSRCIRPDRSRDTRRVRRPTPAARRRIRRARRSPSGRPRWRSRSPPQVCESVTQMGPTAAPRASEGNLATSMLKILRPGRAAEVPAGGDQDRSRHRQRHRHPRRAGLAPPRHAGADARRHRDPRQPQHQRHVRQRRARRVGGAARRRHRHDRQRRPGVPRRHAGPPHRDRGRDPHRRPRGARRHVDHRGQQDAAGQHLDGRAPRHADGGHRAVGRGQVDVRPAGRRLHPSDDGHGVVRRPRRPRRVRLAALPDRDGAAGRRGARPADRQAGADVRRRTAAAARHQQGRPRTGRQRRCSRNSR